MTVNAKISQSDYNNIRNDIIKVMGASSSGANASYGYGQTTFSSAVALGQTVKTTEWDLLRYDIINALTHQSGTASVVQDSVNNIIRSNATLYPYTSYVTLQGTATGNRFNIAAGQYSTVSRASKTYTADWNQYLSCEARVTFPSSQAARQFFNSGGKIRLYSGRAGGTGTDQDIAWSNLLNSVGVVSFGAQTPTSGFFPINASNFYTLSSTYQVTYTQSYSSTYSGLTFQIESKCDVSDNSTGTASVIDFRISWIDNHNATGAGPDNVTGTLTVYVDELTPIGNLVPTGAAWSITSPTYSVGAITNGQTYSITQNVTSLNENSSVTFTVQTSNVPNGTLMYWDIEPVTGNLNSTDFTDGAMSGYVTISGNTATFTKTLAPYDTRVFGTNPGFDEYQGATTEGTETFRARLRTGGVAGTIQAYSNTISVGDLYTYAPPTYIQFPSTQTSNRSYFIRRGSGFSFSGTTYNSSFANGINANGDTWHYIYTADEIKRLGWYNSVTINGLSFTLIEACNGNADGTVQTNIVGSIYTWSSWQIAMCNTSTAPGGSLNGQLVNVIPIGSWTPASAGISTPYFPFTSPFIWDGTSNIGIGITKNFGNFGNSRGVVASTWPPSTTGTVATGTNMQAVTSSFAINGSPNDGTNVGSQQPGRPAFTFYRS